jgi:hypothetical protein
VEIARNIADYRRYLRDLVDAKAGVRGDDLTSELLAIHPEDPERLTLAEIASILFSLSFAGHETTTGLIGNLVRRLVEDPTRWDQVADTAWAQASASWRHGLPWRNSPAGSPACASWRVSGSASTPTSPSAARRRCGSAQAEAHPRPPDRRSHWRGTSFVGTKGR